MNKDRAGPALLGDSPKEPPLIRGLGKGLREGRPLQELSQVLRKGPVLPGDGDKGGVGMELGQAFLPG